MKTADLVTFTEEILNVKLHFLCSIMAPKNGISVSPWQDNAFLQKNFKTGTKHYTVKKINSVHLKNINTVKAIKQQFYTSLHYYQKNMVKF